MKRKKKDPWKIAGNIYLVIFLIFVLVPLILMVFDSFKMTGDLLSPDLKFTGKLSLAHYRSVFEQAGFGHAVKNSLIVATCVTALTVICGATSAFSFTRFHVMGSTQLSNSILIARMIPSVVMAIPLYIIAQRLNLSDTYFILIVAITTFALPFQISMLNGFFAQIPKSLDEAARIDGCNYFQVFYKIVLPSAAPGLAATAIMTFFFSWNELFFALCLMKTPALQTLHIKMQSYIGMGGFARDGMVAAGSLVSTIPGLIVFICFQKFLVTGLTSGSVK